MKNRNIQILDLEFEYQLWKNWLQYAKVELNVLSERTEVLEKEQVGWKLSDSKVHLLENQLVQIINLEKKIKTLEQEMAFYAKDYPIDNKHSHYLVHEKIRFEIEKMANRQAEIMTSIYPLLCYPLSLEDAEYIRTK